MLAQIKGLRFYQTRSHAITLSDTLPAICICMKTREELYCIIFKSPRLLRVALVPNSQHVQKDVLVSDSRKSDDRENEVHQHRKTCGSDHCVDFRIPGIPLLNKLKNRKEKVRRIIEQFESHPNKNMLLKDYKKSEEMNHFSQESKDLIIAMGQLFESCETSSKRQYPDCATNWEIGIVYCTCGKCMQLSERNRQLNKDRFDSLSIPGCMIKKNQSRGPTHDPSMRQTMYHKARDMLRKAKVPKNAKLFWEVVSQMQSIKSHCPMKVGQKRKSDSTTHLSWKTIPMKLHVQKGHDGKGTGKLFLNTRGEEDRIRQRPDFRKAKHAHRRLYKEHVESTGQGNTSIHPAHQRRKSSQQQFEHEEYASTVHPRTGWRYNILQQVRLHPRSGSSTMIGSRIKVGIIGGLQPGLNSKIF